VLVRDLGHGRQIFNGSEKIRGLDQNAGGLRGNGLFKLS
jgi:hypothetical protein